ncbi:MAG: nucleoside phosphorylase [Armatimonadota bacterium]
MPETAKMIEHEFPILEFDDKPHAIIEPVHTARAGVMHDRAVACFNQTVIDQLVADGHALQIHHLSSSMGKHPIYEIQAFGTTLAVFQLGLGASFAAALLEEVISLGCRRVIVCGSCGVLDSSITKGTIIVPTAAIRDEGTSYHYLPPAREIKPSPEAISMIADILTAHKCRYLMGKTWTTDAIFRETPRKVNRRRSEGCLAVEMEASALFAVAHFRNITIGQLLSSADDVSGEVWDSRCEHQPVTGNQKLFWLAAEVCAMLQSSS